jgi:hypothetical protein
MLKHSVQPHCTYRKERETGGGRCSIELDAVCAGPDSSFVDAPRVSGGAAGSCRKKFDDALRKERAGGILISTVTRSEGSCPAFFGGGVLRSSIDLSISTLKRQLLELMLC